MMTRTEHLLACLAEECDEVGQRVMKALRFGLSEVQRDQPLNNAQRITEELHDLIAVARLLEAEGIIANIYPSINTMQSKREKIERYMQISEKEGALRP